MKLSAKAQESIKKVIAKFESGDLSPITQVARIQLDPSAPARNWSLSNRVISFIQSQELDCRGFRQWESVGRSIKKGSKAAYIFRPITIKTENEESGETKQEYICIGFSAVPVFPASSTNGESEIPGYKPTTLPNLVNIAQKFGISVEYVPVLPDRLGDCTPDGKKIRVGTHNPAVFFHELAHAIHARIDGELKGSQTEEQETIAEFTAAVLSDFYGYGDTTGNAWKYISHYAKDPLTAITKALGTVEKVLAVLLEEEQV
jgi:antirestriction protein ArdC